MGDRALVVFKGEGRYSPTVYLHWLGSDVPALIEKTREVMGGRFDDLDYTCARFIAVCAAASPGATGLGVFANTEAEVSTPEALAAYSHGDAGAVLVDCDTGSWTAHGGYLARQSAA